MDYSASPTTGAVSAAREPRCSSGRSRCCSARAPCSPHPHTRPSASRSRASTAAATTSPTQLGPGRHELLAGRAGPLRRRPSAPRSPAPNAALRQQPGLQRPAPEPVLRARRHPVGLRRGDSSSTTPSACGRRPASATARTSSRTSRSTRPTRWRSSDNDLGVDPVHPLDAPRPAPASPTPRQQINTVSSYIDAWAVYGGTHRRGWTGCGRARSTATRPTTAPRCCCRAATCRAGTAAATPPPPGDGRRRSAPRPARTGRWSPVTCGPTRTSADRDPHAVRPRTQPDRRPAAGARSARRTSSRSPGGS